MPLLPELRRRWQAWWTRRHPRTDAVRLDHRRLYILPTPSGLLYGVLLVCLLLASINYQLNLGHLLTFTLASAALVALHATHATLSGLRLQIRPSAPGFVGETVELELLLQDDAPGSGWRHPTRLGRHGIEARWRDAPQSPLPLVWPDGSAPTLALRRTLHQRGHQSLPPLELSSRFPLGLFRVWTLWRIAHQPLAWPAPEVGAPPLPRHGGEDEQTTAAIDRHALVAPQPEPGDDDGVRPWRREDRPSQVHWRRSARSLAAGGGLLVRETPTPPPAQALHLDGQQLLHLDPELRLRRLCAWALEADRLGLPYQLSLGALHIPSGTGPGHRRQCLDALALWDTP